MEYRKTKFGGFLLGKIIDSFIIGVICYICCRFMRIPYTSLVAVIIGVTNIIPFFALTRGGNWSIVKQELRGSDMTHNHPKGSDNEWSFSESDRSLFLRWELNILRGVDEFFEYEFNRDKDDVDELIPIFDFDDYSPRHQAVIVEATKSNIGYRRRKRG